jgi:hypothetical protein
MGILKKAGHFLLILAAVLVIVICIAGVAGTWWLNRTATDVTLQVFSIVDTGVSVVEAGVDRVENLVATSRTEVQQAEQSIVDLGGNLQENSPLLVALNNRIEARLAPTVNKIQEALAPVQDALQTITGALQIANSLPFVQEKAPELGQVEQALTTVGQISADVQQAGDILRATVVDQKNELTQEAVSELTTITTRVDGGLGQVQATVQGVQGEINVLQDDLAARKSRLLLTYNLVALALTLLLLWLIYSQMVVIRSHWGRIRAADTGPATTAVEPSTVPAAAVEPPAPPPGAETPGEGVAGATEPTSPVIEDEPAADDAGDAVGDTAPLDQDDQDMAPRPDR